MPIEKTVSKYQIKRKKISNFSLNLNRTIYLKLYWINSNIEVYNSQKIHSIRNGRIDKSTNHYSTFSQN